MQRKWTTINTGRVLYSSFVISRKEVWKQNMHDEITKNQFSFEPVINTEFLWLLLRINKNQISQVSWDISFDRLKKISGNKIKIKINSWKHDSFLHWPNWDVFPFLFCTFLCCYSQLLCQKQKKSSIERAGWRSVDGSSERDVYPRGSC